MAARALVDGLDDVVVERLRVIAPSAHWRHTWLLAVGAVYRDRPRLFGPVLHMMRELDASDTFSLIIETGPRLAIDILDDGMASKSPKHLRLLVDPALQRLTGPNLGTGRLGDALAEIGDDEAVRPLVIAALQRAWDGSPSEHELSGIRARETGWRGSAGRSASTRPTHAREQAHHGTPSRAGHGRCHGPAVRSATRLCPQLAENVRRGPLRRGDATRQDRRGAQRRVRDPRRDHFLLYRLQPTSSRTTTHSRGWQKPSTRSSPTTGLHAHPSSRSCGERERECRSLSTCRCGSGESLLSTRASLRATGGNR